MSEVKNVWIAVALPHTDGSGQTLVLGAYSTRDGAQARCWRHIKDIGYEVPTDVYARVVDDPGIEQEEEPF